MWVWLRQQYHLISTACVGVAQQLMNSKDIHCWLHDTLVFLVLMINRQATTCSDANYIIGSCHHKYDDSDDCADSDDSSSEEREDKCAWLACVGGSRIVLFR